MTKTTEGEHQRAMTISPTLQLDAFFAFQLVISLSGGFALRFMSGSKQNREVRIFCGQPSFNRGVAYTQIWFRRVLCACVATLLQYGLEGVLEVLVSGSVL